MNGGFLILAYIKETRTLEGHTGAETPPPTPVRVMLSNCNSNLVV